MSLIKISRSNFFYNLDTIKNRVGSVNKIAIVLKDNAYGHGILEIAKLSKEYGVKTAIVRDIYEAKLVRKFFDRVLVLSKIPKSKLSRKIHITVNSLKDIKKIPKNSSIELKINSGMNRNGIDIDSIFEAIKKIQKKSLILKGVFTHYRSADENNSDIFIQERNFNIAKNIVLESIKKLEIKEPYFHSCNSAATFRLDSSSDEFVRVGIASYGYLLGLDEFPKLKPVLGLYANKIASRVVPKNSTIGYGSSSFITNKTIQVSSYDIGYGDGFFRLNENQKYILPNGDKILGRVSMDSMSINSIKKSILIFNDATNLASIHNTIIYEILVSLSFRIKRVIN